MSVQTAADENVSMARTCVSRAITSIGEIVVNDCLGSGDLTDEFKMQLEKAMIKLLEVQRTIGRK
jgi:hypothetical protein